MTKIVFNKIWHAAYSPKDDGPYIYHTQCDTPVHCKTGEGDKDGTVYYSCYCLLALCPEKEIFNKYNFMFPDYQYELDHL